MSRHVSHEMHDHSLAAYAVEEPKLSRRADEVLAWITAHGAHTDREVARGMGFAHRSAVQPRISELIDAGKLLEVTSRKCPETGKTVRVVDIDRPGQRALFS